MEHDDGDEPRDEDEVQQPGGGAAREAHQHLGGEQHRGRQEGEREREEHDLAGRGVADGEERRVLAEDVEERLRERKGAEGGQVSAGPCGGLNPPNFTAPLPLRHHRVTYFGLGRQIRRAKETHR